jgi:undecaprenyl diphosphate synthase
MSTGPSEGLCVELTCDGNRRYEQKLEGLNIPTAQLSYEQLYAAYRAGGEATKKIIEVSRDNLVGIIAAWTWSTENWKRRKEEADAVFAVTSEFLQDLKDNWVDLPENSDVRLVHMGRTERLHEAAPEMMQKLEELCAYTRERAGMVVALLMDYSGPDELTRALERRDSVQGKQPLQHYLDLPVQGVSFKPLDLRIRTGETNRIKHINEVMCGYATTETREIFREETLPDYSADLFRKDLEEFRKTEKRRGA